MACFFFFFFSYNLKVETHTSKNHGCIIYCIYSCLVIRTSQELIIIMSNILRKWYDTHVRRVHPSDAPARRVSLNYVTLSPTYLYYFCLSPHPYRVIVCSCGPAARLSLGAMGRDGPIGQLLLRVARVGERIVRSERDCGDVVTAECSHCG
jgi:hypothetical protein